jgi:hypothetical protein
LAFINTVNVYSDSFNECFHFTSQIATLQDSPTQNPLNVLQKPDLESLSALQHDSIVYSPSPYSIFCPWAHRPRTLPALLSAFLCTITEISSFSRPPFALLNPKSAKKPCHGARIVHGNLSAEQYFSSTFHLLLSRVLSYISSEVLLSPFLETRDL